MKNVSRFNSFFLSRMYETVVGICSIWIKSSSAGVGLDRSLFFCTCSWRWVNYAEDIDFKLLAYLRPLILPRISLLLSPTYCLEQRKHSQTYIMLVEPQFKLPIIPYIWLVTVLVILWQEHNISHGVHLLVPRGFEPPWLFVGLAWLRRRYCIYCIQTVLLLMWRNHLFEYFLLHNDWHKICLTSSKSLIFAQFLRFQISLKVCLEWK